MGWTRRFTNLGLVVVVGMAGALLVSMAIPRTVGAFALLRGNAAYDALRTGREIAPDDLERLAASRRSALASRDDASIWSELALADLESGRAAGGARSAAGGPLIARSVEAGRRSLMLNPANGYAWIRLAQANFELEGPSPATVRALEMALATAPYDRQIVFAEVELCLMLWSRLDDVARARAREQFRYALRRDTGRLVGLAKRYVAVPIVRQALAPAPDYLRRFDEAEAKF